MLGLGSALMLLSCFHSPFHQSFTSELDLHIKQFLAMNLVASHVHRSSVFFTHHWAVDPAALSKQGGPAEAAILVFSESDQLHL